MVGIPVYAGGILFHVVGIRFYGNSEGSAMIGGDFEGILGNYNCRTLLGNCNRLGNYSILYQILQIWYLLRYRMYSTQLVVPVDWVVDFDNSSESWFF